MEQWHSLTNTNIKGLGQACEMSIANACAKHISRWPSSSKHHEQEHYIYWLMYSEMPAS